MTTKAAHGENDCWNKICPSNMKKKLRITNNLITLAPYASKIHIHTSIRE